MLNTGVRQCHSARRCSLNFEHIITVYFNSHNGSWVTAGGNVIKPTATQPGIEQAGPSPIKGVHQNELNVSRAQNG